MLRSTSVVMTTIRAPLLMLVSPVSSPTLSAPCCGGELRELLVAERLHRRRVEDLLGRVLQREVHRELGDDRLARAGRRRDQHAAPCLEHAAGGLLERVQVEGEPGAEVVEVRSRTAQARGGVALRRRQGHAPDRLASNAAARRATIRSCQSATKTATK